MWLHFHRWEEIGRYPVPALGCDFDRITGREALMEVIRSSRPRTAVHLRCKVCGDVKARVLEGVIEEVAIGPTETPTEQRGGDARCSK